MGAGVLALAAVAVLGHEIERHLDGVEAWIAALGPWGPLACVGLFVLATSLFVPDMLLCVLVGGLFGLGWGAAVVALGNLLATTLQYALSRGLLRARIQRSLARRPSLAAIQRAVLRDQLRLQLLLRLTPLNPATISYLLGAAGVRFWGFVIASFALLPLLFVEVYLGYAGRHLVGAAASDRASVVLHDAVVVGGLAMLLVAVWVVSRMARRAVQHAISESEGDPRPAPASSRA